MRSSKALQVLITGSAVTLGAAVSPVLAQNSPVSGNFSFSTNVGIDTNPNLSAVSPGTVLSFSENIGFSITTETSTQKLDLSGSTALSYSNTIGGGSSTSIASPRVNLQYVQDAANSNIDVTGSFWSDDVVSSFDSDPSLATNIIVDTGTLTRVSAGFVVNMGLSAPISYSLSGSYALDDYSGTSDPALFDSVTTVLGVSATARLSPVTQGTFSVVRTSDENSDSLSTRDETADFTFQLNHSVNSTLDMNGNIGFQTKSSTVGGATVVSDGYYGGIGFVQMLPNGSLFGDASYSTTGTTDSAKATLGRSVDFPLGSISGALTADWNSSRGTQLLGSANFARQLPDGSIDVRFSQSVSTNTLAQDIKYSYLGLSYQKTLNSDSGIDLSLDISRSEDGGAGSAPTLDRATLSTSYSRALNSDWNMSVGYKHRQYSGSAVTTANSDSIFMTLTKNLQFGF